MGKSKAGGFYAVARGRSVGVYMTWDECKSQIDGFKNARYKKFPSKGEAEQFISENAGPGVPQTFASSVTATNFNPNTNHKSNVIVPKESYTVNMAAPSLSKFQFPEPSRLQQSRTAILINPLHRNANPDNIAGGSKGLKMSAKREKRSLKVTNERVTGVKRLKTDANVGVNLKDFNVDEDGYVIVYTDGACTKNGQNGAKAGVGVWFGDDHKLNISEPALGRQTNNTAEIQAAEKAIIRAKNEGITKLKLMTDSQFTINCITTWIHKWKRNGWKLSDGKTVVNQQDLQKLDNAMDGIEIKWSYVAGHKGIYGNEQADRLAVAGAQMSVK